MDSTASSTPSNVAALVGQYLRSHSRRAPSIKLLREFIETAFYASMKTEESRSLVKLSQAAPPWSACIAVCGRGGRLFICGLFDQEVHYRNSLNWEQGDRFDRPGIFQVELAGVGSLAVHDNLRLIATLSQNTLVTTFHDVLQIGPVAKALGSFSSKLRARVRQCLEEENVPLPIRVWQPELQTLWVQTLSRILLNIKRSGHGGSVLFTPGEPD